MNASTAGSSDAAVLRTLSRRIYTAHIGSVDAGGGIALAEAYDANLSDAGNWLSALSVRNHVGQGAECLITGFVIDGPRSKSVLLRGVGPGLAGQVQGYLTDPQIELWRYQAGGWVLVAANDDWAGTDEQVAAFAAVGMGALTHGSKDAALWLTLEPGIYTLQISGGDEGTGVALAEIYEAPAD